MGIALARAPIGVKTIARDLGEINDILLRGLDNVWIAMAIGISGESPPEPKIGL